jgi:uncharacterized protein (TIGR02117 family)
MTRRLAVWSGRIATVIAVAFLLANLLTARWGNPALYPPLPHTPVVEVFVVSHGYHTDFVVSRTALGEIGSAHGLPALTAVAARFSAFSWLEIGWGEEEFYRSVPTAASLTAGLAARALLRPGNPSVLHVVGLSSNPRISFPAAQIVRVDLSEPGFARVSERLNATFAAAPGGVAIEDLGPGLYGPSLFFRATGNFNLFNVCNHWVASLLDAGGVPMAPMLATLPQGLLFDLRWRSGLVPLPLVPAAP